MELVIDSKREMVVLVVCVGVGRVQQPTRVLTLYALLFWEGWGGGGCQKRYDEVKADLD
jgi:hypothetical protein